MNRYDKSKLLRKFGQIDDVELTQRQRDTQIALAQARFAAGDMDGYAIGMLGAAKTVASPIDLTNAKLDKLASVIAHMNGIDPADLDDNSK